MNNDLATVTLLTIIAEAVLADQLTRALLDAGATGYTMSTASGQGSRHLGATTLGGENVRIEVLLAASLGERLLGEISARYFTNYGVVAWLSEVRVIRGDKYA